MSMFDKPKNKPKFKFKLGSVVKDRVTGFSGIIVYRTQWLNNCNTYGVKPQELKDGVPMKTQHFDEPDLSLMEKEKFKAKRDTGGPAGEVVKTNVM